MKSHKEFSFIMNRKKSDITEKIKALICDDDDNIDKKKAIKRKMDTKRWLQLMADANVERKYHDKAFSIGYKVTTVGCTSMSVPGNEGDKPIFNGRMCTSSSQVCVYSMNSLHNGRLSTSNDMLKGLTQGSTASDRIGSQVLPKYIKGSMTFVAAVLRASNPESSEWTGAPAFMGQSGEGLVHSETAWWAGGLYMRTTFRMVIVKDLQVNAASNVCQWNDVFENKSSSNGIHSEQAVANMGRYTILRDETFQVTANDPIAERNFFVTEDEIGIVRYAPKVVSAGEEVTSMGIFVIWSAMVNGAGVAPAYTVTVPNPFGHSRLCFTDQ